MNLMRPFLIVVAISTAWSQPAATRPEFDVASLKPVVLDGADTYTANLGTVRNGVLTMTNVTLADCLRVAYGIPTEDQIAGPDWIKSKGVRFDILAKAPPDTPRETAFRMLQPLLEQRFSLTSHREPREMSYLALTVAKGGPRMPVAKEPPQGVNSHGGNRIYNYHIDMPMLAYLISRFTRNRVLDMTGLKGYFEVKLDWAPEERTGPGVEASLDPVPGDSIFVAVQKQLGLKLEARKGPVEILVVDHANRTPLEN
jgi:uncharacterized protein (TIGR03435 family)